MSDTVKPMALSTAIRLGAMLKPQGFGQMRSGGGSCAIAAACDAIGATHVRVTTDADALFPELKLMAECPAGEAKGATAALRSIVVYLNDSEHWTREQIADWVEQIEQQHGATVSILDQAMSEVTA